jgi:transposase
VSRSRGFQSRMIERMAGPEGISAKALSREVDIPQPTLSRWLKSGSHEGMSNDKDPRRGVRPASEKLRIVVEAGSLKNEDLGELLRSEGTHETELNEWRQAMMANLAPPKRKSSKKSPEEKKAR